MMPFRLILPTLALLASTAGTAIAARQEDRALSTDKPFSGLYGPSGPTAEDVSERLHRLTEKFSELQSKFALQTSPEAANAIAAVKSLLAQAQQALAAGNPGAAMGLCDQIDRNLAQLNFLGNAQAMERIKSGSNSGPGGGFDTTRLRQDLQINAEFDIQRTAERLAYCTQRLETVKNPQAASLAEKIRALVEAARKEAEAGRVANVRPLLAQAESLLPELQRLILENLNSEKQNLSGQGPGSIKDQQPATQPALGQAWETYRRVYNSAVRLAEKPAGSDDARAAALRKRVSDLLEKAKEALEKGQAEAGKEYCLKAENQLTEWHRTLTTADNRLSPATWERLKAKLDRAADLVSASGNDKAARILEKGREHFERAQRSHAEGQTARAEVEMDLALKLAAKAVDIARAGSR